MAKIELKSNNLKEYIRAKIGKTTVEEITEDDIKKVLDLKIDKEIIKDLHIEDLNFFENLKSLSLSGVDIGDKEVNVINNLKNMKTLSVSYARIKPNEIHYLSSGLENVIFVHCMGVDVRNIRENSELKNLTIIDCKDAKLSGISQFENLKEVNLPNNEFLSDSDISELWDVKSLERVNLDGDKNISNDKHEGIEVSHEEEYRQTERIDWDVPTNYASSANLTNIARFSSKQLQDLSGINIKIEARDLELLKSPRGQEIIDALKGRNGFSLFLDNTAELDIETMENLNKMCDFDRVHIGTGWPVTQNRGYSYETYKAIKQEIENLVKDIDPKLSEQEKYIEIRKRITENIKYDHAALSAKPGNSEYYTSRNLQNGLLNHTCVCAGYADIMKNVLAEVGIECKYVEGKTHKGELHAWNQVKLKGDDGQYHWYNDDVTWDAVGQDKFRYCLLNDEEFSKTHRAMPSRTEGNATYKCRAAAPAAVRAAKNPRKRAMDDQEQDDAR